MYRTNNITSPNPDSSGASTSLDKNTKKKKQRLGMQYNVQNKQCTTLKIRIPAVPRRHWTKTLKKKQRLGMQYNVQNKQHYLPKSGFQRCLDVTGQKH